MIFIDIGANEGKFSFPIARRNTAARVFAVEPIAELAAHLRKKAYDEDLNNIHIIELAVAETVGRQDFNISGGRDMATSSLLPASPSINDNAYWKSREDLRVQNRRIVEVTTLEALMAEHNISAVDFIKIDAQGKDLAILDGAGAMRQNIRSGVIEVPSTQFTTLYEGEPTLMQALSKLDEWGFLVYKIQMNDPACNELNLFFVRKGECHKQVEKELNLSACKIYSEKDYWLLPTSERPSLHNLIVSFTKAALKMLVRR